MSANPVGWFEIYVQDLNRAAAFYEQTFACKLQSLPAPDITMMAFPMNQDGAGCAGALVKMEGKDSGIGGTIVYFKCDDCAVEAARAAASGGTVVKNKFSIGPYGFIALFTDPDGNMIGLHSMK